MTRTFLHSLDPPSAGLIADPDLRVETTVVADV